MEKRCEGGGKGEMIHKVLKDGTMEQQRSEGGGRGCNLNDIIIMS